MWTTPWPWGSSLHNSWVLRLDPGNKLSEPLCQYETLAATMGSASNYTVDRHQHKGAERGPLRSHTHRRMSQCAAAQSCVCTVYTAFVDGHCSPINRGWSVYENQGGRTSLWLLVRVHVHSMSPAPSEGPCMYVCGKNTPVTKQQQQLIKINNIRWYIILSSWTITSLLSLG